MSRSREVELKLDVTPAAAARLRNRSLPQLGGEGTCQHLVSVYFDTRQHALRKAGLTLRVREDGERRIQTVKAADGGAGMFERSEWESEIEGSGPDLAAASCTPAGKVLDGKGRVHALAPVFETIVDRTVWRVAQDSSDIEVALDEGRVVAGSSTRPIAELELELKSGSPADLFTLMRRLDGARTLKLGVLSKSERGYALADGDEPRAVKAEPVGLRPGMSAAEGFGVIAHACIRHFRVNEPLLAATRSAEPLHQSRVAIRRLRSALSLFSPLVGDDTFERLKRRLRDISRQLGEARNLDVYLERAARPEADREGVESGAAEYVKRIKAERAHAYERVLATLDSKRFNTLMFDVVAWVDTGSWRTAQEPERQAQRDQPIEDFAATVLERSWRKLRKKGRHLAKLEPADRHRARIAAKKLRYASEFFSGLAVGRKQRQHHKSFITSLEGLQDCLGELNDIQTGHDVAVDMARRAGQAADGTTGAAFAAGHISGEQDARMTASLESANAAHRKIVKAKRFWSPPK